MKLADALKKAIDDGWIYSVMFQSSTVGTIRKTCKTETVLRILKKYKYFSDLNHDKWTWNNFGRITYYKTGTKENNWQYVNMTIDLYKQEATFPLDNRRKRFAYMNALLKRKMAKAEAMHKFLEEARTGVPTPAQAEESEEDNTSEQSVIEDEENELLALDGCC